MNFQQVEETVEQYDPQGSVVRSQQKQEERQPKNERAGGIPGPLGMQGTGSSAMFRWTLFASSGVFHSMPESRTEMIVSGRPVVVSHALFVPGPLTPHSSWGLFSTLGS